MKGWSRMKLGNILKKELRELLTVQAVFSMIFVCVLLILMGQVMGGAMDEALNNSTVNILDLDGSEFTEKMLAALPDYGAEPNLVTAEGGDYYSQMKKLGIESLVIIPENFGSTAASGSEAPTLECVNLVEKGGLASSMSSISASSVTSAISDYVSDYFKTEKMKLSEAEQELLSEPLVTVEYTAANGKTVKVSSETLIAMMMNQSMIAPMAVFFLVLMASQMIMTAISTEKIDKTLETLLSAPVSRITVLTAKMIAALIVALLNAGSMIVGFVFYIQGIMGTAMESEIVHVEAGMTGDIASIAEAMSELGFTLSAGNLLLFGLQLFLTIAIGLSLSLILGAMATDVKSVQTLVLPIIMLTMIPFFVTMFSDVNSLAPLPRIFMYIIPFTHTYIAMNNMFFGHMGLFWAGLAYQTVFFVICMYLAVRMFTTDLLFTMNFSPDSMKIKKTGRKKTQEQ